MKKIILILLIIGLITILFVSCIPSVPPTPSEGEGEEEEVEPPTSRVVLVELFNTRGCPACAQINPIVEEVAQEYDKSQVILIEEAGWGLYSTPETSERYRWYLPESKERTTPNILFNGLNQRIHPGASAGGGEGPTNHRPIINSTPPTTATVGIEYSYQVMATDADGDSLVYSLNTAPEGMVIEVNTGLITWTPTEEQVGEQEVEVEVSDGKKAAKQEFIITVEDTVYGVHAVAITLHLDRSKIQDKIIPLKEKEKPHRSHSSYKFNNPKEKNGGDIDRFIELTWDAYEGATGYKVYRSINGDTFLPVYEETDSDWEWYLWQDYDVVEGNSYAYYVTAYGDDWETNPSQIATIDTWLPPCSLISPPDGVLITDPKPVFEWSPVGIKLSDLPYGSICFGETDLWVYDINTKDTVWWSFFDDLTISNATYNQDEQASPLVLGHSYQWNSWAYGYDESGNLIAISGSEDWKFDYGEGVVISDWTVMVYMDGDNDLEYAVWDDLGEMESIGSTDEVKIVIQLDSYNNEGTYRYCVTGVEQGTTYPYYSDDIVETLSEQNMADPDVLADFVNWAITNYPAKHYLLVLWNHGGGWRVGNIPTKGIIWDDTDADFMTMTELVQGLGGVKEHIDILGLDACLMQMAEVAWEIGTGLNNPPAYLVASQESEWNDGWPYDEIFSHLIANPAMKEANLCEVIVDDYIDYCAPNATLSAIHLSSEIINDLLGVINAFANALINSSYPSEVNIARLSAQSYIYNYKPQYKDLYDFAKLIYNSVPDCQTEAQAIMDFINNIVIAEAHVGISEENSHGLSIYLPDIPEEYDSDYDFLQFAINTQWDEFLTQEIGGNDIVYRAFCVGVGDYISEDVNDLPAPPYDVDRMREVFNHCKFGSSSTEFSVINDLKDWQATKSNILQGIPSTFSGADNNDISYFYFSGHGSRYENASYLCPADITSYIDSFISVDELESVLSTIPGIKVVFIDSCHSGGFIGKGKEEMSSDELVNFNNDIINLFSLAQFKDLLTTNQYKVLTSCHYYQECCEIELPEEYGIDPFGLFTLFLCEGCGYDSFGFPYSADTNTDTKVSLQEAYLYIKSNIEYLQSLPGFEWLQGLNDVQVYPDNSTFPIVDY